MTFKRFEEILKTKYPEATACAHGTFGGTQKNGKTEITFKPGTKCYCYYGSYQSILGRLGFKTVHRYEIKQAEERLARYIEQNGKPDEDFGDIFGPLDYTRQIAELSDYLDAINRGEYIIID